MQNIISRNITYLRIIYCYVSDNLSFFHLSDRDGLIHFAKTVIDIVNSNNEAQRIYRDDASRTMNCEQIVAGKTISVFYFSTIYLKCGGEYLGPIV